jgi:hypothetical protein
MKSSCVNNEISVFNRKLAKCVKIFSHSTILDIDLHRGCFTNHGLHLNGPGKDMISKQIVSEIYSLLQEKVTVPICLEWKNEYTNMALNEGTLTIVIESSVEITSPTKSISDHVPQNGESTSTKIIADRVCCRRRRVPVTRSDDFLW